MWNKLIPVIWVHDKLATLEKKICLKQTFCKYYVLKQFKEKLPMFTKKTPWTMYLGSNSTTDTEILTGHQKYIEA